MFFFFFYPIRTNHIYVRAEDSYLSRQYARMSSVLPRRPISRLLGSFLHLLSPFLTRARDFHIRRRRTFRTINTNTKYKTAEVSTRWRGYARDEICSRAGRQAFSTRRRNLRRDPARIIFVRVRRNPPRARVKNARLYIRRFYKRRNSPTGIPSFYYYYYSDSFRFFLYVTRGY